MKLHLAIYPVIFLIGYLTVAELCGKKREAPVSEDPRKPAEGGRIDPRIPRITDSPSMPTDSKPDGDRVSNEHEEEAFLIDRALITKMGFNLFDPARLELRKSVCEHLGLDALQTEAVNGEIQRFFIDLRKLEAQHSEVIQSETGEPFVRIAPYPQAKQRADDFVEAVSRAMTDKDRGISFGRLLGANPAFGTLGEMTEDVSIISYAGLRGTTRYMVERIFRDEEERVVHSSKVYLKDSTAIREGYEALFEQQMK